MLDQARTFLASTGYRGFANFDVKVDPRTGAFRFFEVNPRIGRNNYYVTAAGANPMRFVVEDARRGPSVPPVVVDREILYSVVPHRLLLRYVRDPQLRRAGAPADQGEGRGAPAARTAGTCRRVAACTSRMALVNQVRKFRRYYPEVTSTGF